MFLLFFILTSFPSSVTPPTPVSMPSVLMPETPIASDRPTKNNMVSVMNNLNNVRVNSVFTPNFEMSSIQLLLFNKKNCTDAKMSKIYVSTSPCVLVFCNGANILF